MNSSLFEQHKNPAASLIGHQYQQSPFLRSQGGVVNNVRGVITSASSSSSYKYDQLYDVVTNRFLYSDGEVPWWLERDYDTAFSAIKRPGIPSIFEKEDHPIVIGEKGSE
ncbi:11399_t:CDS:1 [Ambispora leptoticha]|uniref:11399_t:CDS:1 n=1 Tax=Ambispora leptoticha TaxID=144679 RepID=A0A9N9FR48_9GLOM|nr:11399_t:CDS:1 [Ambispora leptoticha]